MPPQVASSALDFVDAIEHNTSKEDVIRLFTKELRLRGFDSFGSAEIPSAARPFAPCLYVSTMPEGWVERYVEMEYVQSDPMARLATMTSTPFRWTEATNAISLDPNEETVMNEICEFGVNEGLVVPIHAHRGYCGAVTFAGGTTDLDPRQLNELYMMSMFAHNRLRALHIADVANDSEPQVQLTPRECECLHWAANGKSDWAISQILKISEHTVHEHVERAKKKYNVSTRVQAIVLAILQGQVRP